MQFLSYLIAEVFIYIGYLPLRLKGKDLLLMLLQLFQFDLIFGFGRIIEAKIQLCLFINNIACILTHISSFGFPQAIASRSLAHTLNILLLLPLGNLLGIIFQVGSFYIVYVVSPFIVRGFLQFIAVP